MQSNAKTADEYIASLPEDRRRALTAIRDVVRASLDPAYEEGMGYGMMGWDVPHSLFPAGYHCNPKQPLPFVGLASQKNHISLYLMGLYVGCVESPADGETDEARWFREAWLATGKKLDLGKSCVRFRKLEDAALDVIGEAIRRLPAREYIARYEQSLAKAGITPRWERTKPSDKKAASAKAKPAKAAKVKRTVKKAPAAKKTAAAAGKPAAKRHAPAKKAIAKKPASRRRA